jgi:hypothetical protein
MAKKFLMFVTLALCSAMVYSQSESDFRVELNEAGDGVVIQKYNGKLTQIVIPKTIQGMPVVELAGEIFTRFSGVTDVKLPEGLIKIGDKAFSGQKKITAITFPASLKYIGGDAFSESGLTKIIIPETIVEIGLSAFERTPLAEVILSKNLKVISRRLFQSCERLTSITLPEGLEEINEQAFYSTGLTKIVLPKSLKLISERAFSDCSKLTEIVFPENTENILFANVTGGRYGAISVQSVFVNCPNLSLATQAKIRKLDGNSERNKWLVRVTNVRDVDVTVHSVTVFSVKINNETIAAHGRRGVYYDAKNNLENSLEYLKNKFDCEFSIVEGSDELTLMKEDKKVFTIMFITIVLSSKGDRKDEATYIKLTLVPDAEFYGIYTIDG